MRPMSVSRLRRSIATLSWVASCSPPPPAPARLVQGGSLDMELSWFRSFLIELQTMVRKDFTIIGEGSTRSKEDRF